MTTSFPHRLRALAAVSFACATIAPAAHATHDWNGYHWAGTGNGFSLKLGDNVSSTWDPILRTTSLDWSLDGGFSNELDTTIVAGLAGRKCRATTGRVEVCNSTYGKNGWLGVAQIWIGGPHITQGVVKLNDSYFNSAPYNTTEWRNLVMCQEVGHTLGLDHQDEIFGNADRGTCMDYTNNPSLNQHPNAHDYEQLALIYDHPDGTTTVDQSGGQLPAGLGDLDLSEPHQWGKLVKKSRDGRHAKYAREFGGGYQVHTFVIWADEKEAKKN